VSQTIDFLFISQNPLDLNATTLSHEVVDSFDRAVCCLDAQKFHHIIIDLENPQLRGLQVLEWVNSRELFAEVGIMAQTLHPPTFLSAMKLGASFHLKMDDIFNPEKLLSRLMRLKETRAQKDRATRFLYSQSPEGEDLLWIGRSPQSSWISHQVKTVAESRAPALILGETGSGKRLVARMIHALSGLKKWAFLDLTQVAPPEHRKNLEAILAENPSVSLCLSGVDLLSPPAQDFLYEHLVVGHTDTVQITAIANRDLNVLAAHGKFKQDLALWLSRTSLMTPPLRERKQDIALLADHFLNDTRQEKNRFHYFLKDALLALIHYDWPGNVAELKSVLTQILANATQNSLGAKLLPQPILSRSFYQPQPDTSQPEGLAELTYFEAKKQVLNRFNHDYIGAVLSKASDNLTVAAEFAGMDRSNFKKIMKKFGIAE
jgi:DNA-binding NtrC family response regulator